MAFRPCIDLRDGRVVQIVGGTLTDDGADTVTNFVSEKSAGEIAELYRGDRLRGGHVIMLGPGNESAAREALSAYPGGLQLGGGINPTNALEYLEAGASHVIVTSYLFTNGELAWKRLNEMHRLVGKSRLVIDLSCRKTDAGYFVATDRWQKITEVKLDQELFETLDAYCDEFLIHAADVEGKCQGIDTELVALLGEWVRIPTTYAGGAKSLEDVRTVESLSNGKVDLTIGSALDIFGGSLICYEEAAKIGLLLS